jgi:hypothetical protein
MQKVSVLAAFDWGEERQESFFLKSVFCAILKWMFETANVGIAD